MVLDYNLVRTVGSALFIAQASVATGDYCNIGLGGLRLDRLDETSALKSEMAGSNPILNLPSLSFSKVVNLVTLTMVVLAAAMTLECILSYYHF